MIPKETSQDVLFATDKKDVTKSCGVPLCKSDEIKNKEGNTLSELPVKTIPDKKPKRRSLKELDELRKQQKRLEEKKRRFYSVDRTETQEESLSKYGFYTENNCYYFNSPNGNGFFRGSNFVMEPLYHISSVFNAKRLFRLTNVYGHVQVLEFSQKDLISVSSFKLRCESVGNFLFEGQLQGLNRIKAYLYDHTKACKEIERLGWQKQGFFAWSNGITVNGNFTPTDDLGIVEHNGQHYYIPALSSFYMVDETFFQFERKFVHKNGDISLFDFTNKMLDVYGENAIVGMAFYFATLFRDIFVSTFRFFPILNIFGLKGTGKSEMAISLLRLFGDLPVGDNMTNTTVPAMADHVARTCNTLCHLDEYKNSLEYEKIEFLKGLWDGVGRSRLNMEKNRRNETTAVDVGIILTGQEMATVDNALFSRVLFLSVSKTGFSDEERFRFKDLKETEGKGLTHITNRLMSKREKFKSRHVDAYNEAIAEVTPYINRSRTEDRTLKNWCLVLAALKIVMEDESLPFTYENAVKTFAKMIKRQNIDVVNSNEVTEFWNVYQELFSNGLIEKDYDFHIKEVEELKTQLQTISQKIKVLYMNPTRIFGLYAQQKHKANEKRLPKASLKFYLQNSTEYLGQQQRRFRRNRKNLQGNETVRYRPEDGAVAQEYERPNAWCFDYEMLQKNMGLSLETEFVWKPEERTTVRNDSAKKRKVPLR